MAPTSANSLRPYTVPKLLLPKSSRKFLSAAITGSNSVVGDSSQHADNNNADDKFELLTQKFKQIEAKYRDLVIENEKSCLEWVCRDVNMGFVPTVNIMHHQIGEWENESGAARADVKIRPR